VKCDVTSTESVDAAFAAIEAQFGPVEVLVSNAEAVAAVRALLDLEGIFAGVSSGATVHVARKLAAELDEGVVVCILADGGWKYLTADFWDADDVTSSMERTLWW
jgi:cysteine synthase B